MIGSLGTVVIFWLCGALERKTVIEKVSPEMRDATIQAEYTQATSDETSDFRQMHRAQTSSSYHLYIGTFYTGFIRRFSTSPAKNCFVNFFYCRYVRGLDFSGLWWDAMTFWIALRCIDCTTYWTKTPSWPLIERGCKNPTWYSAERSVPLHSFDFTKYRLWTSLFRLGKIVNGQIVVCSFDLTEYHL